MLYIAMQI